VELGKELDQTILEYQYREKSLISTIRHLWNIIWKMTSK
jgi:hypothetical protein